MATLSLPLSFPTLSLSLSTFLRHVAGPNALYSISQVVASVTNVNEYTHIAHTPASPQLIAMFFICLVNLHLNYKI